MKDGLIFALIDLVVPMRLALVRPMVDKVSRVARMTAVARRMGAAIDTTARRGEGTFVWLVAGS
jgi:hypothetical protein